MLILSCGETELPTKSSISQVKESRRVEFEKAVPITDLAEIANQYNLAVKEISFQTGDISGGFTFESQDIESEIARLEIEHQSALKQVLETANEFSKTNEDSFELSLNRTMFQIEKAEFLGSPENFDKLSESKLIKKQEELEKVDNEIMKAPMSSNHESWAPYKGASSVEKRFISHIFYFDNTSAFDSRSTYEHETQIYFPDYADYGGYWSSNLPRAYKDTQFEDRSDIVNLAIGSAKASDIRRRKGYFCYMRIRTNKSVCPKVRIKGQLGRRKISWCYSTWCIFAKATTSSMATFYAPTQGVKVWKY